MNCDMEAHSFEATSSIMNIKGTITCTRPWENPEPWREA